MKTSATVIFLVLITKFAQTSDLDNKNWRTSKVINENVYEHGSSTSLQNFNNDSPQEDEGCRHCRGTRFSSSCHTISGVFRRKRLRVGSHIVTTIPQSACQINITAIVLGRNKIDVNAPSDDDFVSSSVRRTEGVRLVAGTVFIYSGFATSATRRKEEQQSPENASFGTQSIKQHITAEGPINTNVDVLIVQEFKQEVTQVQYSYVTIRSNRSSARHKRHPRNSRSPNISTVGAAQGIVAIPPRPATQRLRAVTLRSPVKHSANSSSSIKRMAFRSNRTLTLRRSTAAFKDFPFQTTTYRPTFFDREDTEVHSRHKSRQSDLAEESGVQKYRVRENRKRVDDERMEPVITKHDLDDNIYHRSQEKDVSNSDSHSYFEILPGVSLDDPVLEPYESYPATQFSRSVVQPEFDRGFIVDQRVSQGVRSRWSIPRNPNSPIHQRGSMESQVIYSSEQLNEEVQYEDTVPQEKASKGFHEMDRPWKTTEEEKQAELISYAWKIFGFTNCSKICGGGIQSTLAVCVRLGHSPVQVTDENCDEKSKPRTTNISCNTKPCQPSWEVADWSQCSVTCDVGRQTRSVDCRQRLSSTVTIVVPDIKCHHERKPETGRICSTNVQCFAWKTNEWSECSSECGRGRRSRDIFCEASNGSVVEDHLCESEEGIERTRRRPKTSDDCEMEACPTAWYFSNWSTECSSDCGDGVYTRRVHCAAEADSSKCNENTKPLRTQLCRTDLLCTAKWFASSWTSCSVACGHGLRRRDVVCMAKLDEDAVVVYSDNCNDDERPTSEESCSEVPCLPVWFTTEWSKCSKSCGPDGVETRGAKCLDDSGSPSDWCDPLQMPQLKRSCVVVKDCNSETDQSATPTTETFRQSTRAQNVEEELSRDHLALASSQDTTTAQRLLLEPSESSMELLAVLSGSLGFCPRWHPVAPFAVLVYWLWIC